MSLETRPEVSPRASYPSDRMHIVPSQAETCTISAASAGEGEVNPEMISAHCAIADISGSPPKP